MKHEFTIPLHKIEAEIDYPMLNKEFDGLIARAHDTLMREGMRADRIEIERYVDVKYFSQSRFFTVEVKDERISDLDRITKDFMAAMQAAYGYTLPPGYAPVELVESARCRARTRFQSRTCRRSSVRPPLRRPTRAAAAYGFADRASSKSTIYERDKLPVGIAFEGPAIVEQPDTTTVMPPGTLCTPDRSAI